MKYYIDWGKRRNKMKEYAKIDVTEIMDGYEIDYEVFIKHLSQSY